MSGAASDAKSRKFSKRILSSYRIQNVTLWGGPSGSSQPGAEVWVEQGRLRGISAALSATTADSRAPTAPAAGSLGPSTTPVIDGRGLVLMPAGVDAQVHLRVPGQPQKETAETGLLAALHGGYSAVLTMPNTQPTVDSVQVLRRGQEEVSRFENELGVRVFWSAALTKKLNSQDLTDYQDLVAAGVRAFTNDGLGVESDAVMEQAFARLEKLGVPLLQHAEFLGHGGSLAPGPVQRAVGAHPYPDEPEWKMVERDLRVLRRHPKARYHVLHVSSRKTLDLVRQAKAEGLRVTAEVSPHHLYFNSETIDGRNPAFKMNPPIRSPEDQAALWAGLSDGGVDFVATDHAPHEELMKTGSFDQIAFGTLGLETTLHVLIDGMKKGLLPQSRFVDVFAARPARFLGLPEGLGRFVEGAPFHAVWVDVEAPAEEFTISRISSLSKNSCFLGCKLPGRIKGAFHETGVFEF